MNEGRNLVKDAVSDAKELREAATAAAKHELIESMSPQIKRVVEAILSGKLKTEDTDRIRRGMDDNWPGESHTGFEEGKDKGDRSMSDKDLKGAEGGEGKPELDMESIFAMFPGLAEKLAPGAGDEEEMPTEGDQIPALGEGDDFFQTEAKKEDDEDEEKVDETIEISEEQLKKVYEDVAKAAALVEVQVTKSFGEMSKSGELDEVDPAAGIADVKKGEHAWEKETPPAKQDFSVKEIRAIIARGLSENRALKSKLIEAVKIINTLRGTLHETNLFNSKILHVNSILNATPKLTKEQKKVVMESIDSGKTMAEVKSISDAITNTLKAAGQIAEGRNPRKPNANSQRVRTSGTPNEQVLRESVDRNANGGDYGRLQQLAGLTK